MGVFLNVSFMVDFRFFLLLLQKDQFSFVYKDGF